MKPNPWVWTEIAEQKKPDRKAGTKVDKRFLTEGFKEYRPYPAWIKSGYVRKEQQTDIFDFI